MSKDKEKRRIEKVIDFSDEFSKIHNTTAQLVITIIESAARACGERILEVTNNNLNDAVSAYEHMYIEVITTVLDYLRTAKHEFALDVIKKKKIELPEEAIRIIKEAAKGASEGKQGTGKLSYIS